MQPNRHLLEQLPYTLDVARLFQVLAGQPWSIWLDSGKPSATGGRYDILAADPTWTLVQEDGVARLLGRDGSVAKEGADALELLREILAHGDHCVTPEVPLTGGVLGYFSYDFGRQLENLPGRRESGDIPQIAVGIYDWVVVVDHLAERCWLAGQGLDPKTRDMWGRMQSSFCAAVDKEAETMDWHLQDIETHLARQQYAHRFERIQSYIHEGDCYQVNFAQRFAGRFKGDAWSLYQRQRKLNPSPYGAFLNLPFAQILSSSPEQFLGLQGRDVVTRPIKGTRARGGTAEADRVIGAELQRSAKDRAENLMIVDLLRNDLGKVCVPGSISVPKLFEVEGFPLVHHLVSTVQGKLAPGRDALALLAACFPGGSITGAPKHRAMQIIDELEHGNRGVYCGSIGWLGFDGNMDSNIAIRTLVIRGEVAEYWSGGGIVADSEQNAEYQECLDKAAGFFRLEDAEDSDEAG